MFDMSDNEADTIVVAMAAPNGPLGDAFEVSNAAAGSRINSHAKTPRKQKPAARRKPTTKSPSVAPHKTRSTRSTASPAPAAKLKRTTNHARNDSSGDSVPYSLSPSPATTTNTSNSTTGTPTGTPTSPQLCGNSSIANAATIARLQNTRVVRFKKQLCTQWDIEQADLNAVFNSATIVDGPSSPSKPSPDPSSPRTKSPLAVRDFLSKLVRMAEMTDVSFDVAKVQLERAREERAQGNADGTFEKGGKDRTQLWIPTDVDRATDLITATTKARAGSKKRTASEAGTIEDQARPPPAERQRAQAEEAEANAHKDIIAAQKSLPSPLDATLKFAGGRQQGLLTPTDEMDTRSDRASVPRASSIEAMNEVERNEPPQVQPVQSMQPQPRPQPAVVVGPAREQAKTPSQAPPEKPCLQPLSQPPVRRVAEPAPANSSPSQAKAKTSSQAPSETPAPRTSAGPHAKEVVGQALVQSSPSQTRPTQPQSRPQPQLQVVNGFARVQVMDLPAQPAKSHPDPKRKEVTGSVPARSTPQDRPMQPQSRPQREAVDGPARAEVTLPPMQLAKPPPQPEPSPNTMGGTGVVPSQASPSQVQPQPEAVGGSVQITSQAQKTQPQRPPESETKSAAGAARPQVTQIPANPSNAQAAQSRSQYGSSPKAVSRTDSIPSQPTGPQAANPSPAPPQAAAVNETTRSKSTPLLPPFRPPQADAPARREQAPPSPALRQSQSPGGGGGAQEAPDPLRTRQRMDLSTLTHPAAPHAKAGPVRPSTASPTLPRPQPLPQPSPSPAPVIDRRMSDPVWKGAGKYRVVSSTECWLPSKTPVSDSARTSSPISNTPISNTPTSNAPMVNTSISTAAKMNAPMPNSPRTDTPMSNSPVSSVPMSSTPVSTIPRTNIPKSNIPRTNCTMSNMIMYTAPASNSPVQRSAAANAPASSVPAWNATAPNGPTPNASNGIASTAAPRPVDSAQTGIQDASSKQDMGEVARAKHLAGDHSEALRRLNNDQTLPPPIFDHILQMFCSVSASHIAVPSITTTAKTASQPSFLLLQYSKILVPFYIDNNWSLAMIELESKEMTIYGTRREQKKTESATIDYLNASLDGADPMAWKSSYVELGLPTNYWDQPIVCLVAAIHVFCNMSPPSQNPDPTIWRGILAMLLQGITPGSDLPPRPTKNKAGEAKQDADVNPANFSVPATSHSLPIQNYLAHMSKALADFHARYRERASQLRNLAAHTADAKSLTDRLAHPSHLNSQRLAYERRQGEMRALIQQTESMMATLTRMRAAGPGSATMKELTRYVEGARAVVKADAAKMERLERLTGKRELVAGLVGELADMAAWRARRLEENWVSLWGKVEGDYGRMLAVFGTHRAGGAAA